MTLARLTCLVGAMLVLAACSGGGTVATGSLTSGTPQTSTPPPTTTASTTPTDTPSDVTQSPTATPKVVCGNGAKETGEQCDDGNTTSGDGCSAACVIESCGDGVVQAGLSEECDGSNLNGNTCVTFGYSLGNLSCGGSCKFDKSGCSNPAAAVVCGNGIKEAGEQCDDNNKVSGDGCSAACVIESCGDGIVQSGLGEECDGSNLNGSSCATFGYTVGSLSCSGTCKFVKTGCSAVCGNGTKETGEQCDDGNTLSWDGCTSTCQNEAAPTFSDHFTTATNSVWTLQDPYGSVTYAAADALASDQKIAKLTFSGGLKNADGPGNSTQIATKSLLGFGMYRARFNFAKCNSGEDLMNGIFVYSNDDVSDTNNNGIVDNNEIDIELLCGTPQKLYLTTWTDYESDKLLRKFTRVIDLNTGKAYETPAGQEGTYDIDYKTVKATIPEMVLPKLATDDTYYEMGFEWHSTSLRYFIVLNGKEVTLWNYTDSTYIPQNKAYMMFNLWYPSWSGKSYPASAESLKVDWFKYWAN